MGRSAKTRGEGREKVIRDARRRKPAQTSEERMLHAAAVYLTERGYTVATISADRVETDGELQMTGSYDFVIRFSGIPPRDNEPAS
jgi:hypothetical protein